ATTTHVRKTNLFTNTRLPTTTSKPRQHRRLAINCESRHTFPLAHKVTLNSYSILSIQIHRRRRHNGHWQCVAIAARAQRHDTTSEGANVMSSSSIGSTSSSPKLISASSSKAIA